VLQIAKKDIFFQKEKKLSYFFFSYEIKNLSQTQSYRRYLDIDILLIDNLILVL